MPKVVSAVCQNPVQSLGPSKLTAIPLYPVKLVGDGRLSGRVQTLKEVVRKVRV